MLSMSVAKKTKSHWLIANLASRSDGNFIKKVTMHTLIKQCSKFKIKQVENFRFDYKHN